MAISKSILLFTFVTMCCVGYSMQCIEKLVPCLQYLNDTSASPPASCCLELRGVVSDDSQCLCTVFNDPAILNLAEACDSNFHCKPPPGNSYILIFKQKLIEINELIFYV